MKYKTMFALFLLASFFLAGSSRCFAFFGQLETKRERREREAMTSSSRLDAYEKIQESFLKEDYETAVQASENYLARRNNPRSDEVLYLEALSLLKLNRTSEARDKLKSLEVSTSSEDLRSQAAVSTGDSYYLANDTFLAIHSYEDTLKKYPRAAEVPYVQSRLLELSKKLGRPAPDFSLKSISGNSPALAVKTAPLYQKLVEENSVYAVQVGSFSREKSARSLVDKLTRNKYDAYVDSRSHDRMYRVRVGKLASRDDAEALETRLRKDGYPTKICP